MCGSGVVNFTEDSGDPVRVAELLTLMDADADHEVTSARVALQNPQEGDEIGVDGTTAPELSILQETSTTIAVNGTAMTGRYHVSTSMCDRTII